MRRSVGKGLVRVMGLVLLLASAVAVMVLPGWGATALEAAQRPRRTRAPRQDVRAHSRAPGCGTVLGQQVYLDRRGFSPGEIDGRAGDNLRRALAAYEQAMANSDAAPTNAGASAMASTGAVGVSCALWTSLSAGLGEPTTNYTLTDADVRGPFAPTPDDLMAQAALPALGYQSIEERVGEMFHASPALIRDLNPGRPFTAGQTLTVPNVDPLAVDHSPVPDRQRNGRRIEVSRSEGWLRVFDLQAGEAGTLLMHAPASSGSTHDPLPLGTWRITSLAWRPEFRYNPDLFWDADASHAKATIQPGPNGPVGLAWLGINVEHYGLHGTAHPDRVGHTESHGCVRLTNWDVARLMTMVTTGTPVLFRE